mmetsp:Transcript_17360/g.54219  ORF Transcript_17360/g.54219 Transcript_17360/m.54219 type:complete len:441 (-) Transcript_17360:237-1559(-)
MRAAWRRGLASAPQAARERTGYAARALGRRTAELISREGRVSAANYAPLEVVLARGEGVKVWDVEGWEYLDFLSAYSAVNQGHCHPRIVAALREQAETLCLTSRAFHNDQLGEWCEFATAFFGYERLLPMNTGVEACETSVKLARRWAYATKGVAADAARVIVAEGNFWGRSIAAISASTDPSSYARFGPLVPGFDVVPYGDAEALERRLVEASGTTAAVMLEPIQGEAGVVVPPPGYLAAVRDLCTRHGVLLICDEVQTGLGRTGELLASDREGVRPDLLVLGKALSGGVYPVSAVLASSDIMLLVRPGEHGSTYGGNPVACRVARAALDALVDNRMVHNARARGEQLEDGLRGLVARHDAALDTRGAGLLRALLVDPDVADAHDVCLALKDRGLLAKPTHNNVIRLAPPLVISPAQVDLALQIFDDALACFDHVRRAS